MSRYWFIYNGPPGMSAENMVGYYDFLPISPDACAGGNMLCAIYARKIYNTDYPRITHNLQTYIWIAKTNQSYYPSGVFEKPYVYSRL